MAGLDPEEAWDRTPGELVEYTEAYRERMRRQAYLCYCQARATAAFVISQHKPEPWEAFPQWIKAEIRQQSPEDMLLVCQMWCGQ